MNNKIFKFITGALLIMVFSVFTSCDEGGDQDAGATSVVAVAGDWTVEILRDGDVYDHGTISTYNTAANTGSEMWLDDLGSGWGLKTKVNLNLDSQTFFGTDLFEEYYGVTVTITEGEIVEDGATAPSGTIVDSITFTAVFSDIPNEVWIYSGYKRTGFLEDE